MEQSPKNEIKGREYSSIISVIGSPLRFFGLIALVCNAIFSIGAGLLKDSDSFAYCIHMFLGIIALFAAIAVWCPRALYHPRELSEIQIEDLPYKPLVVTIIGFLSLVIYIVYRMMVLPK